MDFTHALTKKFFPDIDTDSAISIFLKIDKNYSFLRNSSVCVPVFAPTTVLNTIDLKKSGILTQGKLRLWHQLQKFDELCESLIFKYTFKCTAIMLGTSDSFT